jgi:2',3'-cyclic-nucleotide 2'-phosphodiesterase (5'-nucleotidase family)
LTPSKKLIKAIEKIVRKNQKKFEKAIDIYFIMCYYNYAVDGNPHQPTKKERYKKMTVREWVEQMKAEGMADFFVVYANIGNNTDELVACEVCEAEDCEVVDTTFVQGQAGVTAVITAEA